MIFYNMSCSKTCIVYVNKHSVYDIHYVEKFSVVRSFSVEKVYFQGIPVDKEFTKLVKKLQDKKNITIEHGVEMYSAIELEMKEHDPHDLNRFDPVMVIIEYMRIDNLRLIDMFGYLDTDGRGLVSRDNLRAGVAVRGLVYDIYVKD